MHARLTTLFVCLATVLAAAQGQQPANDPQTPRFRAGANYVRVDMYATEDSRSVDNLTAADIDLREDGVAQEIASFESVQVRGASPEAARIEPSSVAGSRQMAADPRARVFVVFLDTLHTSIEGSANMRLPLVRFLDRVLGPDDLVAVMTPEMSARDLAFGRKTTVISNIMQTQWDWGRRDRAVTVDPKEQLYEFCYPAIDARGQRDGTASELKARRREKLTLDAVEDLVTVLAGLREERKAVLTVTEGWLQYRENRTLASLPRDANGNPVLEPPDLLGRRPRGRTETRSDNSGTGSARAECEGDRVALAMLDDRFRLNEITEAANRGNVSFYPVYARGLAVFDSPIGPDPPPPPDVDRANLSSRQESLRFLADNTDGLAIVNTNQVESGINRVVADLSSYYLIGYYSTNTKLDGKFRTISVRVKRPGVRVRARRGYRGLTPGEVLSTAGTSDAAGRTTPDAKSDSSDSVASALSSMSAVDRRAAFRIRASSWNAPASGDTGNGAMWLVGELDYGIRKELAWSTGAEADVTVVAADGTPVLTKTVTVPAADGTFAIRVPDSGGIQPGEYAVRVRVRPRSDPSLPVTDIARVQMPQTATSVGEAVLWRRGPSTGLRYLMTADPRFMRTERVRLELPTRTAGAATARLLDRSSKPMSIPVQVSERVDTGSDFRWIVADVTLAPLAPGDYAIEVTAEGVKRVTAFRVVP